MKLNIFLSLVVFSALAATGTAATFSLTTTFDSTHNATVTSEPFVSQIVGLGTLSYRAEQAFSDGHYRMSELLDLRIVINTIGSQLDQEFSQEFTENDLVGSISDTNVEVRGAHFFFSNFDVESLEEAARFRNETHTLTAYRHNGTSGFEFGTPNTANFELFEFAVEQVIAEGTYGVAASEAAIPETSTTLTLGLILGAAAFVRGRRIK